VPYVDQALNPDEAEKLLYALVAIVVDDSADIETEFGKIK
jgi:hypothetical protein